MNNQANEPQKGGDGYDHQEENPKMIQKVFQWFRDHHGIWTAIFTGLLVVFTYLLYRVTDATNETNRATQRAFLNFGSLGLGARFNNPQKEWQGQEIAINWTNAGSTPATGAIIQSNAKPQFEDLPKGYDFPLLPEKTELVFGPKGTWGVNLLIPKTVWEDTWHGKSRLFVWGAVAYRDVFPNDPPRLSEFCVEITHLTTVFLNQPTVPKGEAAPTPDIDNPNVGIAAFQWQACKAHNCYDADCKDYSERIKDMLP